MARKLSILAPDWWDYTTLDDEILNDAARLTAEDMAALSREGFKVVFYDTLEDFCLAEALEYITAWKQATLANPAGICGPIGPTEQLPLVARLVNELELDLNGFKLLLLHGHQFELDPEFDGLFSEAASRGARLALFGHNHQAGIYERAGIFLLNPGSLFLAEPEHSLGVIRAEAGVLELGIYNLKKGAFTDVRKIPGGS